MKFIPALFIALFFFAACQQKDTGFVNGMVLPNMSAPDSTGKVIELSDYKGSIVLLDFWASWCAPCRKANPKLLAVQQKYEYAQFKKAQRFVVLAVSLDNNKQDWLKAIDKDGTESFIHISELKGWKSKAILDYKINAIPASFLLDENGTIIGKNMTWRDLDLILSKQLF